MLIKKNSLERFCTGYNLCLIRLAGVVALSGVVVNDSLTIIDYANRKKSEMSPFKAIHTAGIRRFRPIMLTKITAFGEYKEMAVKLKSVVSF